MSSGSPITFNTWPSMPSPTGIVMPWPVLRTSVPRCRPSVGFMQMTRHAAFADLLRDLGGDRDRLALELDVHLERVVDLGQRVGRELDVDDRSGDRDDAAVLQLSVSCGSAVAVMQRAPVSVKRDHRCR